MAEKTPEKAPGTFSLLGTASTMGLHMVSGPGVGGGLGWLIDSWLDSWPVASAIGLVFGLAAGFRNLERSNAAIDAERRKTREEAEESQKSVAKKEESGVTCTVVPFVHKRDVYVEEPVRSIVVPAAGQEEERERDDFTAEIMAGTAAPEERNLEERDETEEAIRRVLTGEGDTASPEKGSGNGGKGSV